MEEQASMHCVQISTHLSRCLGKYFFLFPRLLWLLARSRSSSLHTVVLEPSLMLRRGDPKLIGLGFSVFAAIIFVEQFGSPMMKSASILIGLGVGCIISGATGYWSRDNIDAAPAITFLWVHTFKLSIDGALILPLLIMFICEGVSCMPDILATAEISGVDIEGTQFNSRIQGGILCDGIGSFVSALGTGLPMVSQAGNNGVIVLTSCAASTTHV